MSGSSSPPQAQQWDSRNGYVAPPRFQQLRPQESQQPQQSFPSSVPSANNPPSPPMPHGRSQSFFGFRKQSTDNVQTHQRTISAVGPGGAGVGAQTFQNNNLNNTMSNNFNNAPQQAQPFPTQGQPPMQQMQYPYQQQPVQSQIPNQPLSFANQPPQNQPTMNYNQQPPQGPPIQPQGQLHPVQRQPPAPQQMTQQHPNYGAPHQQSPQQNLQQPPQPQPQPQPPQQVPPQAPLQQQEQQQQQVPPPNRNPPAPPPLHPEIRSVVQLTIAHAHKVYFSGPLVRKFERQPDRQKPHKDDGWTDVWAQLGGTTLSVWDMKEIQEASKQGKEVPPSYINVTDAFVQVLGSLTVPATGNAPAKRYNNILTLNTAGSNLLLFSCPSTAALISWAAALRLAAWEKSRLEEIYTAHLIRITLNARDVPTTLVRGKMEGWARVRIAGQTDWKKVWLSVSAGSEGAHGGPSATLANAAPTPTMKGKRLSNFFSRDNPGNIGLVLPPRPIITMYTSPKPKDRKKPLLTLFNVTQAFGVYPERPDLINKSTLMKIEGTFGDEEMGGTVKGKEGWVLIMPELNESSVGPGGVGEKSQAAEMLKWIVALHDSFELYGRPEAWTWDPRDNNSLMFGYPVGPQKESLFLDREIVENMDPREDRTSMIRGKMKELLNQNLRPSVQAVKKPEEASGAPILPTVGNGSGFQLPQLDFVGKSPVANTTDTQVQASSAPVAPEKHRLTPITEGGSIMTHGRGMSIDANATISPGATQSPLSQTSLSPTPSDFPNLHTEPQRSPQTVQPPQPIPQSPEAQLSPQVQVENKPEPAHDSPASSAGPHTGNSFFNTPFSASPSTMSPSSLNHHQNLPHSPLGQELFAAGSPLQPPAGTAGPSGSGQINYSGSPAPSVGNLPGKTTTPLGSPLASSFSHTTAQQTAGSAPFAGSTSRDSVEQQPSLVNEYRPPQTTRSPTLSMSPSASASGSNQSHPAFFTDDSRSKTQDTISSFGAGTTLSDSSSILPKSQAPHNTWGARSPPPQTPPALKAVPPAQSMQREGSSPNEDFLKEAGALFYMQSELGFNGGASPSGSGSGKNLPPRLRQLQEQGALAHDSDEDEDDDNDTSSLESYGRGRNASVGQQRKKQDPGSWFDDTGPAEQNPPYGGPNINSVNPHQNVDLTDNHHNLSGLSSPTTNNNPPNGAQAFEYQQSSSSRMEVGSTAGPAASAPLGRSPSRSGLGRKPSGARAPTTFKHKASASISSQTLEESTDENAQQHPSQSQTMATTVIAPQPTAPFQMHSLTQALPTQNQSASGQGQPQPSSQHKKEDTTTTELAYNDDDADELRAYLSMADIPTDTSTTTGGFGTAGSYSSDPSTSPATQHQSPNLRPVEPLKIRTGATSPQLGGPSGSSGADSLPYKSSFAPSNKAAERKLKAQQQQAAHQAAVHKPGRANGKRKSRVAGAAGWESSEDEEEDEEEEDEEDADSDGDKIGPNEPLRRGSHNASPAISGGGSKLGHQQPNPHAMQQRSSTASHDDAPSTPSHLRPPRTLPMPPMQNDELYHPQPLARRTMTPIEQYQERRTMYDDGTQIRTQAEVGQPGAARQNVWSKVLDPGLTPGRIPVPEQQSAPYKDTFVQLEPSETMTKAFTPHGLLSAGLQDKEDRSAKKQEELARESGGTLINVPNKPPPPQTGLLGAIFSHERERKREGGVGAALTEREREKRMAEERQRRFDEQHRQQFEQMQQTGSMYGGQFGFNPMMANPMMMSMNPMMGMNPMMTGGGMAPMNPMMTGGMGYPGMMGMNPQQMFAAQQAATAAYQQAMIAFSVAGSQVGGEGGNGGGSQLNGGNGGGANNGMGMGGGMSNMGMPGFDPRMSMMGMPMMGMGMGGMGMGMPMNMGGMPNMGPQSQLGMQMTGMSNFDARASPGMMNNNPATQGNDPGLVPPQGQFSSRTSSPASRGSPLARPDNAQRLSRPTSPK